MSSAPPLPRTDAPRDFRWAIFLAALALVPVVLWPGDVSWLIDEPRLIAMAWHANHDAVLATAGLSGNFGIRYGPLPVQIYQALLLLTHNPYLLVILRGLLCGGATALGLLWLARTLRLPAWFAAAVLLAPSISSYQRILWDATFAIPVGTLAVAALGDFVAKQRVASLRICVATTVLVPLIHPQGLPLFVAIAGWLVWRHRDALWRDRVALLGLGAVLFAFNGAYLFLAAGDVCWHLFHAGSVVYPTGGSRWQSLLAPFLGGNLLAGTPAVRFALAERVFTASLWASRAIYPLAWLGIALAVPRCVASAREGQGSTPRDVVAALSLGGLLLQALLFGALRIPCTPQYFFGTFPFHVLMAWFGLEALRRSWLGLAAGLIYAVGGGVQTLAPMLALHARGDVHAEWLTLHDSVEIARTLNYFTDTSVRTEVAFYARHPQSIRTLRLLLPSAPGDVQRFHGRLLIARRGHFDSPPKLGLFDIPPDVELGDEPVIDVTPLPRGWTPPPETWNTLDQ